MVLNNKAQITMVTFLVMAIVVITMGIITVQFTGERTQDLNERNYNDSNTFIIDTTQTLTPIGRGVTNDIESTYNSSWLNLADNSFLTIADNDNLSGKNFSICFWANANSNNWVGIGSGADYKHIIGKGGSGNLEYWFRWFNDSNSDNAKGSLFFTISNATGTETSSAGLTNYPLSVGQWHYICGTYNTSLISIYRDGILGQNTSHSVNVTNGNTSLRLGTRLGATNENFNGSLDDIRLYNRMINSSEVLQLYNAGREANRTVISDTGLMAWYRFNEASGTTAYDSSGNGYNAV